MSVASVDTPSFGGLTNPVTTTTPPFGLFVALLAPPRPLPLGALPTSVALLPSGALLPLGALLPSGALPSVALQAPPAPLPSVELLLPPTTQS